LAEAHSGKILTEPGHLLGKFYSSAVLVAESTSMERWEAKT